LPNWTTTGNNPDGHPWAILCYTAALRADKVRADACPNGSGANWPRAGGHGHGSLPTRLTGRAAKLAMSLR
jgi:hypothetical protein